MGWVPASPEPLLRVHPFPAADPWGLELGPGTSFLSPAALQGRGTGLTKPRGLLPCVLSLNLSFLFCKMRVIVSPFGVIMRIR